MFLEGLHEREIFKEDYPFRLEINNVEDFQYPLHWHHAIELVYILENDCKVDVNGTEYLLHEREILVIPAGEIHGIHAQYNKGRRFFIQFDTSLLDGFGSMSSVTAYISQTRKISFEDNNGLHQAVEDQILKIIEEYQKKEYAYALALNARIYDLLVILSRDLAGKLHSEAKHQSPKKVLGLQKISSALKYIEENYQDDITLKDVSSAIGFSEYHFSRIFKEIIGKNFHTYLNEFRIKKAEKLLVNGNIAIAEVAHQAGFNSFVTFNRTFKSVKGCTPTYYKRALI